MTGFADSRGVFAGIVEIAVGLPVGIAGTVSGEVDTNATNRPSGDSVAELISGLPKNSSRSMSGKPCDGHRRSPCSGAIVTAVMASLRPYPFRSGMPKRSSNASFSAVVTLSA